MTRYAIFGPGRVGANMAAYLEKLGHEARLIARAQAEEDRAACEDMINDADIVAAAIPDGKLEAWRDEWREACGPRPMIHFSGAVSVTGMHGFHPLYSFPKTKLSADAMKSIAFACPESGPSFGEIFPGAPNPTFIVADKDRARYHALAVLSGNFVGYIWNETAKAFSGLADQPPEDILESYFKCIVDRFAENPTNSITGPIPRRDRITVEKNLASLEGDEKLKELYQAFLNAAWPTYPND